MAITKFIQARIAAREKNEYAQSIIRIIFIGLIGLYICSSWVPHTENTPLAELATGTYWSLSALIFAWLLIDPSPNFYRRYLTMIFDHGIVSLVMALDGERATPLYLVYLWVTMGNGLRYGVKALFLSTLMAVIGFCFVILVSPFWHSHLPLSSGLLITLLAIPAYTSSLVRQLTTAKAAAEQASQIKSRFLATASHELRTPLHAVIGLSDLLQRTRLTSEQAEMVDVVRMSGRTLLTLVEDVLDLTSIQAGKLSSHNAEFDLHTNLAEVAAIMQPQVARKSLTLTASVAPDVPYHLQGDWPHVRQILINLITNAIKFTDTGGIHIGVTLAPGTSSRLLFAISDTGFGIAAADQERIFEAFTQTSTNPASSHGGVGLGLAIVRQLADLLNGKVGVTSQIGEGSVFTVELPFTIAKSNLATSPVGKVIALTDMDDLPTMLRTTSFGVAVKPISEPLTLSDVVDAAPDQPISVIVDGRQKTAAEINHIAVLTLNALKTELASLILVKSADYENSCSGNFCSEIAYPFDDVSLAAALHAGFSLAHRRDVVKALANPGEINLRTPASANAWAEPLTENGQRILVVEDSPVNRMVTSKILRSAGYHVVLAEKAEDALEIMAEQEFNIILMDLNLPGKNGLEIIKLYRVMRMGQSVPPIGIFSADVTEEAQQQCQELGIDLFLPKPIEPDVLIARLREVAPVEAREIIPIVSASVTSITEHPRYKATAELTILDRQVLQGLGRLDPDPAFISELMDTFEKDAAEMLREIEASVRNNDMRAFWDLIHAMRSSAANVGAKQIYGTCMDIYAQGKMSFQQRGHEYAARLRYDYMKFSRVVKRVFLTKSVSSNNN